PPDLHARHLVGVFFTASLKLIAVLVGYGLALVAAHMAARYRRFRLSGLIGGTVATVLAIFSFKSLAETTFFGEGSSPGAAKLTAVVVQTFAVQHQYGLPVYAGLV